MSLPALRLSQAPAPNRGLSIPGLWWQPARITVFYRGRWETLYHPNYTAKVNNSQTVAVSPVGVDGLCYFVAWDIDSGKWEDVRSILAALPNGCFPLVSWSGKKGWHVWLFPDRPLTVKAAIHLTGQVRERAVVKCETFPTGVNSRCLKWPGSLHPETRQQEVFIDPKDQHEFDTGIMLELLTASAWRTPMGMLDAKIREASRGFTGGSEAAARESTVTETVTTGQVEVTEMGTRVTETVTRVTEMVTTGWHIEGEGGGHAGVTGALQTRYLGVTPDSPKMVGSLDDLARSEDVAAGLMGLAGREPVPFGEGFCCLLPGHEERHPSASFFRARDGHILYGDLHRRDGETTYTLGEVYHALVTGQVAKLRPVDQARWLAGLGLRLGYSTPLAEKQRTKVAALTVSPLTHSYTPNEGNYSSGWLQNEVGTGGSRDSREGRDGIVLERVWAAVATEVLIQAFGGYEEVCLSKRFLARRAGVAPELANRAVNLFCVLGVLAKVPETAWSGGHRRGDRFRLGEAAPEEVQRRWEALGRPSLRRFKRSLVAERLGEEVAAAVFRRRPEEPGGNGAVGETVSETLTGTVGKPAFAGTAIRWNPEATGLAGMITVPEREENGVPKAVKVLAQFDRGIEQRRAACG